MLYGIIFNEICTNERVLPNCINSVLFDLLINVIMFTGKVSAEKCPEQ